MTDPEIEALINAPKTITNPGAHWTTQRKSRQKTFELDLGDAMPPMELKLRQLLRDETNFSCVLLCHLPDGSKLTLRRYNGSSHVHGNALDPHMPEIRFACHIHMAKERYIAAGKKTDGYAEETTRYSDLDGALLVAMQDCTISGYPKRDSGPQIDLELRDE